MERYTNSNSITMKKTGDAIVVYTIRIMLKSAWVSAQIYESFFTMQKTFKNRYYILLN